MFIRRTKNSVVKRRYLLFALVPLLSLLSLFTPFFAKPALAVTSGDVLQAARAWSILNAVIDNAAYLDATISNADADKCAIFGSSDNDGIYVGHHTTENNEGRGTFSADGASWDALEDRVDIARSALAYAGIQNGCRGLLEVLGYTSSGGNMNAAPDSDESGPVLNRLRAAVKGNPFFGAQLGNGSPGDAISYAMLYYLLTNVCGWEYRNAYVENDTGPNQSRNREAQNNEWGGGSNNSHFHTYTYEEGKVGENTYFKGGGRTDNVNVGSKSGIAANNNASNTAQLDCGARGTGETVGAKLHDNRRFADAYFNLIRPGGPTTPGTCGEKYPSAENTALASACDEGFRNKTPGYCDKFNGNQALKDACLYGQNTATGGMNDTTPSEESNQQTADKTTCVLPGVGWIVCPILTLVAQIVDGAYGFVATFLEVRPVTMDTGSGLFTAWSVMRNFANVAFVIVFLVIIFSQVTSMGISNYGIKRMLPRLIIAAILVNASFWVCAIAVDLSNIGGSSIYALFKAVAQGISLPSTDGLSTSDQWQGIVGGLLGGTVLIGVALFIGLSALIPVLLACLIAIIIVVVILIIRQALIILLIVISPLAFVAYLLPNTENLFTKWRKLLGLMLLLYPIIALIFGASALASKIVMGS